MVIFFLSPQEELVGDDTIAVQKMCDQKESIVQHRWEKKLVVMLAADGRYGLRCVCVCAVHAALRCYMYSIR